MDCILFNGKIETLNISESKCEAVAIEKGKIIHIGSDKEILSIKTAKTKLVDLKGRTAVPGFIDSHMHLATFGQNLYECNLIGVKSIEELIDITRAYIESKDIPKENWIIGKGWNQDYFQVKKLPTRYDLDKISTEYPICLTRACYHMSIVNTKALEMAGITADMEQVEGGNFEKDHNGELTGIIQENALKLVYSKFNKHTLQDIKRMIIDASNYAVSKGITSIQTDDFMLPGVSIDDVLQAYIDLKNEGKLLVRIYEQCLLTSLEELKTFLDKGYRTGHGDDYFKIGPVKLLADGNLGTRTAHLCEPYDDDPMNTGIPIYTQEKFNDIIEMAHINNMQLAIHCIGDKTMYMACEAIEKALIKSPKEDHRHTIIHCQIMDLNLFDRFKALNLVASVQPIFINYDLHMAEEKIGKDRIKTSYSWRSMIDKGINTAFGSDCPVEDMDVLNGIYAAVTRKDLDGYPEGGWLPEQKLTVRQALTGFTLSSAFASFDEGIKGSIETGKFADITVLSDDIFEIAPDDIKNVKVVMTFVNGQLVYENSDIN